MQLEPGGFGLNRPGGILFADRDLAAIGQGGFKTLQEKEGQSHLTPGKIGGAGPSGGDAAACGKTGQHRQYLAARDALIRACRAKADAEEPDAGIGVAGTFRQKGQFRAVGDFHRQKLYPIADGSDRADKIMADARGDQGGKVNLVGHEGTRGLKMASFLEPGMLVRHPERDDWGMGQVQSVIGNRITVNFEHTGKVVIDSRHVLLVLQTNLATP